MNRVGVCGAGGRMGATVCRAVEGDPDLDLVAAVDPGHEGVPVSEVAPVHAGFDVTRSLEGLEGQLDVIIDFTHLEAAQANLRWAAANGVHAVVGTSGFAEAELDALRDLFGASNCVIAPNFAIGAVLMMRFAELAAPFFDTAEIIELHHDQKVDAPSGTAVATAERMAAASGEWAADPTATQTVQGARGAQGAGGIPIHSIRMRGMVAHQEVVLGTTGQTLTIRHDSTDRSSFMPGVLLAAKRVADHPGVTLGLDTLLGL